MATPSSHYILEEEEERRRRMLTPSSPAISLPMITTTTTQLLLPQSGIFSNLYVELTLTCSFFLPLPSGLGVLFKHFIQVAIWWFHFLIYDDRCSQFHLKHE
jgi:hypothetical protein